MRCNSTGNLRKARPVAVRSTTASNPSQSAIDDLCRTPEDTRPQTGAVQKMLIKIITHEGRNTERQSRGQSRIPTLAQNPFTSHRSSRMSSVTMSIHHNRIQNLAIIRNLPDRHRLTATHPRCHTRTQLQSCIAIITNSMPIRSHRISTTNMLDHRTADSYPGKRVLTRPDRMSTLPQQRDSRLCYTITPPLQTMNTVTLRTTFSIRSTRMCIAQCSQLLKTRKMCLHHLLFIEAQHPQRCQWPTIHRRATMRAMLQRRSTSLQTEGRPRHTLTRHQRLSTTESRQPMPL